MQSEQNRQVQGVFRSECLDLCKGHNAVIGESARSRRARLKRPVALLRPSLTRRKGFRHSLRTAETLIRPLTPHAFWGVLNINELARQVTNEVTTNPVLIPGG